MVAHERKSQVPHGMLEVAHTRLGELMVLSLLTSPHSKVGAFEGCMVSKVNYIAKVILIIQKKIIPSVIIF